MKISFFAQFEPLEPDMRIFFSLFLITMLFLPSLSWGDSPDNLSIDIVKFKEGNSLLYSHPSKEAASVKQQDSAKEYFVVGLVTNVQGQWYEIAYPVKGWVHEADVVFQNQEGRYSPSWLSEEQRVIMRLLISVGTNKQEWEKALGKAWAEDRWKEEGKNIFVCVWPGIVLASEEKEGEAARLIKATVCGVSPLGFGPYLPRNAGNLLTAFSKDFRPTPYASLESSHLRFLLDEEGNISCSSYSTRKGEFLSCPRLAEPNPEEPFFPSSLYPESWCPKKVLKESIAMEGRYTGSIGNEESGGVAILLDSGTRKDLMCTEEEERYWLGGKAGVRVRALYSINQKWDKEERQCKQDFVLQRGRILASSSKPSQRDCKRIVIASGEARGIVTQQGKEGSDWELLLDSERSFRFRAGAGFPWKQAEAAKEGSRVSVQYESVLTWNEEEQLCFPETKVNSQFKILSK